MLNMNVYFFQLYEKSDAFDLRFCVKRCKRTFRSISGTVTTVATLFGGICREYTKE